MKIFLIVVGLAVALVAGYAAIDFEREQKEREKNAFSTRRLEYEMANIQWRKRSEDEAKSLRLDKLKTDPAYLKFIHAEVAFVDACRSCASPEACDLDKKTILTSSSHTDAVNPCE